jgi:hypothetical protein
VELSSSAHSSYYYLCSRSPTRKTPLRQVGLFHWLCSSLSLVLLWHSGCRQACYPYHYLVLFNNSSVGFAINPARDLGPRIMTAMVGYGRQGMANPSRSVTVANPFLMQSSIFVVSTGSGPLFWALFVADFLLPSSMMSSSTAVRTVLSMLRELPLFIPCFLGLNTNYTILSVTPLSVAKRTHIVPAPTRNLAIRVV